MRWIRARLARTLFLSYLLVVLVGVVTLLIAAQAVAPTFFTHYMAQMMGEQGMGGMMGGLPAPLDARLDAAFRAALMQALLVAAAAALVAALLLSLFVSQQITRPVQRMLRATRRMASGHYAERVPITPANAADEVGQLGANFNAMAGALEHTERRRLELIGDVAHELRIALQGQANCDRYDADTLGLSGSGARPRAITGARSAS